MGHTKRPHRLARPRTPAFHAGDGGSNPPGDAICYICLYNPPFSPSLPFMEKGATN